MKKILQILTIVTLIAWGVAFLYFYASGRIDTYLDPAFRVYALVAGIGMLLLGTFNFLNRHRDLGPCTHHDHAHAGPDGHEHHHRAEDVGPIDGHDHHHDHDHDEHDHDHAHGEDPHEHQETVAGLSFAILVLLVPLLVTTSYSKDRFSSEYIMKWGKIERQMMQMRIARDRATLADSLAGVTPKDNPYTRQAIEEGQPGEADTPPEPRTDGDTDTATPGEDPSDAEAEDESWGTFTLEDLKNMVPQNDDGDFLIDVPQIFYTAGDRELMEVMEGIPVETTAQLMEETVDNPDNTRLQAFRLFIECCAADARPLSIPVDFGEEPPEYTEMGWYKLHGKLHYSHESDGIVPIIRIDRIEKTPEPTDGLLY